MTSPAPDVGIVVIGRNEGQRLVECLQSLSAVEAPKVYVDSGSTDNSVAIAEKMGVDVVKLDFSQPYTAARGRNAGFNLITAKNPSIRFVQFIDGDCKLAPTWLNVGLAFIREGKDMAIVCGRRRERYPDRSIYNHLCDIEWNTGVGEALACGGDSLVRVTALSEVEGFRPQLAAGEEPELCARLRMRGWRIWRLAAEMTLHDANMMRFSQWWTRAIRSGYGQAEISIMKYASAKNETRQVIRAVMWGGALPLAIGSISLFHPLALTALLVYPLQMCRIAIRRDATKSESWIYATFTMIEKFAQLQGNIKFLWNLWDKGTIRHFEYK